jgi:hypothetical protein
MQPILWTEWPIGALMGTSSFGHDRVGYSKSNPTCPICIMQRPWKSLGMGYCFDENEKSTHAFP